MNIVTNVLPPVELQRRVPGEIGIWIFILSDMLMFAVLFVLFTWDQSAAREVFRDSQEKLHPTLGLINTLILLTSSWFIALAVKGAYRESWQPAARFVALAILCGVGFMVIKSAEYVLMIQQGYSLISSAFFSYYFIITGIHFLHVLIGLVVLVFLWRGTSRQSAAKDFRAFENGASYWHMVDLLWIAIFPVIYLIR